MGAKSHQHYKPTSDIDVPIAKKGTPATIIGERQFSHSGPIPDAEQFRLYDIALPGAADRILSLAEREAAHRHEQDGKALDGNIAMAKRGQVLAFILVLLSLGVICYGIYRNNPLSFIPGALLGLSGIVSAFMQRSK